MCSRNDGALWASIKAVYLGAAESARVGQSVCLETLHEQAVALTFQTVMTAVLSVQRVSPGGAVPCSLTCQPESLAYELGRVQAEDMAAQVGACLERLRGLRLDVEADGSLCIRTSLHRRGKGVYFTPPEMAREVSAGAIRDVCRSVSTLQDLREVAILDPAVGGGVFLLSALRLCVELLADKPGFKSVSSERLRREIICNCLYGVDVDPVAVATTRALLVGEVGEIGNASLDRLDRHLRVGDSLGAGRKGWDNWFPERRKKGFSAVISNPPWSKLRPIKSEFYEHIDWRVRLLQGRALTSYLESELHELHHESWASYLETTMATAEKLRASDEFPVTNASGGDSDLYKYFLELSVSLLSSGGCAALLLPSGVIRAQGSGPLREFLRCRGQIIEISEYTNRRRIFEIHPMYRFVSLFFKRGAGESATSARFGLTGVSNRNVVPVRLSRSFVERVGGVHALLPEVRTAAERDLLRRLYQRGRRKVLSFRRELDMTNDAALFIDSEEAWRDGFRPGADGRWGSKRKSSFLLPLYEGRMVHQFDHVAKQYIEGHGRGARWLVPKPGVGVVQPHFFVKEEDARKKGWKPVERFGYCEISGHANERTVLAARIPRFGVCGNKVPVLKQEESLDSGFLWLALSNSFVVDWIMRRFVSTTVNQFYWNNIPFPVLGADDRSFLIMAARALSDLKAGDDPVKWLGSRGQLRLAIDAVVLDSFGINNSELDVILDDFPTFFAVAGKSGISRECFLELLSSYRRGGDWTRHSLSQAFRVVDPWLAARAYCTREQSRYLVSDSGLVAA